MLKVISYLILFLVYAQQLFSQAENTSSLSIKEIMKGEDFVGYLPEGHRWSEDSRNIIFSWNPDSDTIRSTYKVNIADKSIAKLSVDELRALPPASGDYNDDRTQKVYEKDGDLFLLDLTSNKLDQITNTILRESSPTFSGDEKSIIFRQGRNLFSWKIGMGSIEQLTNFRTGREKEDPKPTEAKQWLEQDQLAYFDILNKRKESEHSKAYRNGLLKPERPQEIYLEGKQIVSMISSPDTKYVVYILMKKSSDQGTVVPDYVTQSGYTKDLTARSKVGSEDNTYETWIFNREADSVYQVITKKIPGIYDKPAYREEYEQSDSIWMEVYMEPREVIALVPKFSDDGKAVFVVRSQDNKDRWIMLLNLEDGSSSLLDRQRDEAWIGGPGISNWNFSSGNIGWPDKEHIWYQSEETGYSHIYRQNVKNGKKKALTNGNFEILKATLSKDKKTFFITSNMESPHQHHFYHLPVKGGKMKKITHLTGGHDVVVRFKRSAGAGRWGQDDGARHVRSGCDGH